MRNRFAALTMVGLLALGVAACDGDAGDGADVEAPADGAIDPAAPVDGDVVDPALEPTE